MENIMKKTIDVANRIVTYEDMKKEPELNEWINKNPIAFLNESGLTFVDVSSELFRVYEWKDGSKVTINRPQKLNVSKSGGHRLFDGMGISHYVAPGWNHLYWEAIAGQPHFVK
jgi:hypothetical protein